MRTETVSCDLCGSKDSTVVWEKSLKSTSALIVDENKNVINGTTCYCNKCGLMFISPRMTEEATTEFYANEYRKFYEVDTVGEEYHANKAFSFLKDIGLLKPGMKCLDVGCASGKLLDKLSDFGCEAYGCDSNATTNGIAETKHKIFNTRIEDLDEKGFDLITIVNTLEHMHSPKRVLSKLRELLKDDGVLFVVVPNVYTSTIKMSTDAFLSNAHLYHFDVDTLTQYLNTTGFSDYKMFNSPDFNMDKLYATAKKSDVLPLKVDYEIGAMAASERLLAHNYLFIKNYLKHNRRVK